MNPEMLAHVKLASFLALIGWSVTFNSPCLAMTKLKRCIPISSLITPATLNVETVLQTESSMFNVSTLDISQAGPYFNYAFVVPGQNDTNHLKYLGSRTIITRLTVATASTGQILRLPVPFTNATYEQTFFGPFVQCQDANTTVASQIDAAAKRRTLAIDPSIQEVSNEYFAFVPALSDSNWNLSSSDVKIANLTDANGVLNASNQLWLRFPRYQTNHNITQLPDPHYLSCKLHNTSYRVRFSWVNGIQSLDILDMDVGDPIVYPTNAFSTDLDEDNMAYSAVMGALSNQLTGAMGFYQDANTTNDPSSAITASRVYSQIDSNIEQTSLLGSSDLNSYFIQNHALSNDTDGSIFSNQRLRDMALARNRTLDMLI